LNQSKNRYALNPLNPYFHGIINHPFCVVLLTQMAMNQLTIQGIERLYAIAKAHYQKKGLSEPDSEDLAAEVRLCLLRHQQTGKPFCASYFHRIVQGVFADYCESHQKQKQILIAVSLVFAGGGGRPAP